jgi:hypothetical protein
MSVEKAGKPAVPAVEAERVQLGRDEAAKAIRVSLRFRSGRAWSVTVGRGTVWGWLTITAPPSRREEGGSTMRVEDRAELARLLGLGEMVHAQGVMVCPEERSEYVDRARGDAPRVAQGKEAEHDPS